MTTLSYKEYQGEASYHEDQTSDENGFLMIQILHIDDTIMCECRDLNGVQAAFEDLVDDYIETCASVGKEPLKPFKGSFNVRVGPQLHRKAAMSASKQGKTLNAWVVQAIENKLG